MTSLDSATYVVPDHGFGAIHNLPIGDVPPEVFSELLESTAAEDGYLSAELGPRTAQKGFAVRIGDTLVGHLSAADSQAYALFDWVLSAGLRPRATAHVSMTDASGEEWPTLNLLLPAPHLCIPANNPPAQRWAMLPGEAAATMTEFSKDVTAFPQTDEHYLVTLRTRGFLRRNTVDVYINSTYLGSLPREAAREIAPAVLDCTKTGCLAIAHGYFRYNADDRPALTIYAHNAANRHHTGLVLGVVAGGTAVISAATAARAQAASAAPRGLAGVSAPSGFSVTSAAGAAGASGAVTSNLLAAAGVAVLVGGGATVATNLLSEDEALSDTHTHSTAPAPEDNHSGLDSSHFDGTGPKRPAHPATPRLHDADPTSGTAAPSRATSSAQRPLADASAPQPSKPSQPMHAPHADRAKAPAAGHHGKHRGEHRGEHQGIDSQAISRAASAAATAAAAAASNNVESTPASAPSSSSEPAPQLAAKEPAEPSDLPTSSTPGSEKTTSETTAPETTAATSTDKQTALPEPESSEPTPSEPTAPTTTSSLLTSEPQAEPTPDATVPSTTIPGSELEPTPEPEPETTAPTTTIPGSELAPTPEPEPEAEPALPTTDRSAPDGPERSLEPEKPAEPEEPAEPQQPETPGRPEEPEEQTTPPDVIVIVVED